VKHRFLLTIVRYKCYTFYEIGFEEGFKLEEFQRGDFVNFTYDTGEVYPGRIIDIDKGEYIVEICTNKRKNSENELEIVRAKKHQLQLRFSR
jgi:hypothetical protein